MPAEPDERRNAIEAADRTCPRCGAAREHDQGYCLECGLRLPSVTGTVPRLRRAWMRRLGWYPGDWVWMSLLTLVVAGAGAATSIALTEQQASGAGPVFTATTTVPVVVPTAVPTVTTHRGTTTLPAPPEPTTTAPNRKPPGPPNGRIVWPRSENGWTIVLVSYPKTNGRVSALATASKAARAGLGQVGVLDSSGFASLQPGYLVVFAGIYGSKSDADAAVSTARRDGFGGAYSRQIAR